MCKKEVPRESVYVILYIYYMYMHTCVQVASVLVAGMSFD